jgi:hypothetical protein
LKWSNNGAKYKIDNFAKSKGIYRSNRTIRRNHPEELKYDGAVPAFD